MPHIIVEYTENLKEEGNIPALLQKINESLIAEGGLFPVGGIRSRAICLQDFVVADGKGEDDAFVHVSLKIGSGRPEDAKKAACERLFAVIEEHFQHLFQKRYLALSMELFEFTHATYKKNNIHERYR
ncbi:5-carboxymethyl-2-hydroxymuconate Delta-isomerase [Ornithinibacillus halophilus]|uniref:5-carboxymethyl-2-hydroxymuconate delta isomerase n=1 Tax=Ornithinibacillus halophilus TaxID=930117 RepID=A0A1M5JT66_9BACI|nr:5-carboxymethyl-2-hydroxymuconate Delta-isomerase [Ornithinibacillus halophilus]SHG43741.1 5-carboxymethyl-2-hydroxymuconate delta isomerase [Ornithinibacillus halophilus]